MDPERGGASMGRASRKSPGEDRAPSPESKPTTKAAAQRTEKSRELAGNPNADRGD